MTSLRAPLRTLSFCLLALAASPLHATSAQAQAESMDATVPADATVAPATTLDGSVATGGSLDGGPTDGAVTTAVVTTGLDASLDGGSSSNQGGGVTWVHEGCSLAGTTTRRHDLLPYAGALAAAALWLRRRRARRAL